MWGFLCPLTPRQKTEKAEKEALKQFYVFKEMQRHPPHAWR